jgi:hypothetical protein
VSKREIKREKNCENEVWKRSEVGRWKREARRGGEGRGDCS